MISFIACFFFNFNFDFRIYLRLLVLFDKGNNFVWKCFYMNLQIYIVNVFYLQICVCVGFLICFSCDFLVFDLRKYILLMIGVLIFDYLFDIKLI